MMAVALNFVNMHGEFDTLTTRIMKQQRQGARSLQERDKCKSTVAN